MFNITDEVILKSTQPAVFRRGYDFFDNKHVKSVSFSREHMLFNAAVMDNEEYTIKIIFSEKGDLNVARCNCAAYESGHGLCKHIVAVLLLVRDKDQQGFFDEVKTRKAYKKFFDYFQTATNTIKSALEMEITYELHRGNLFGTGTYSSFSMKIGESRLYLVRDIRTFIWHLKNGVEIKFGKGFVYDPSRYTFKAEDKKIIDLLLEIYEIDDCSLSLSGSTGSGLLRERQAILPSSVVSRFLDSLKGRNFKAKILGKIYEEMSIVEEDFPVNFKLTKDGRELLLDIELKGQVYPLNHEMDYFFTEGKIHKLSKKQQDSFKPFYAALADNQGTRLKFLEEDKERFASEVLPFAENVGNVIMDENVAALIVKVDLQSEVYLDKEGDDVTAEIKFIYAERKINPFSPSESVVASDKIIVRDLKGEWAVLDIFEQSEFKVRSNSVYLSDEEKIYTFVYENLPKLKEYAEVFYSDKFKNIVIRKSTFFSGKVRFNKELDLLEFGFSVEGIDQSELLDVLKSVREKRKFFRLKDGSFLPLSSEGVQGLADISTYLDLDDSSFHDGFYRMEKSRAVFLDQLLKKSGLYYVEKNHAFKEFVQNILEPGDTDQIIPENLEHVLRDYQKFGFKWLKMLSSYNMGGILADDMGLGKTVQVITLILSEKLEKGVCPSIVVVPTSLVYNWCAEVEKFAPSLTTITISGSREERLKQMEHIGEVDIVITSYPLIRRDIDDYKRMAFRFCILDEAQNIKNHGSMNAKAAKEIVAQNKFALTGTPMENSLSELWSVFDFILPGYLFNYSKFSDRYEKPIIREDDKKALTELGEHIRPFILRRLKIDVLKELPEKIESKMIAELTQEQSTLYLAYLQRIKREIAEEIQEKGFGRSHIKILAGLTRLRQICCHPAVFVEGYEGDSGKMLLLKEIVIDSIEGGHRILLFSQFTSMLAIIRRWLDEEAISYLYLDGSTGAEERLKLVKSFNAGQGKLFLISLKAGGTGLNLTGADTVIHFDPWWNPAVEDQATDRAYRIGQNKVVQVMKLITKGTIEEKIFDLQQRKKTLVDLVIQPGETMLSKLSENEIRSLFDL